MCENVFMLSDLLEVLLIHVIDWKNSVTLSHYFAQVYFQVESNALTVLKDWILLVCLICQ